MGFGMTFEKFLWHLFSEPSVALLGLGHSIKDIIEILYFYFTELSLTACYVILFIIAARFLLRKAPKVYAYALWGVVYFTICVLFFKQRRRNLRNTRFPPCLCLRNSFTSEKQVTFIVVFCIFLDL